MIHFLQNDLFRGALARPPIGCATQRRASLTALFPPFFRARSCAQERQSRTSDRCPNPAPGPQLKHLTTPPPHPQPPPPTPPPPPLLLAFFPPCSAATQDQRKLDFIFRLAGNYFSGVEAVLVNVSFAEWSGSPDYAEGSPLQPSGRECAGMAQWVFCFFFFPFIIYFKHLLLNSLFSCLF